jgi:hypothetical protein
MKALMFVPGLGGPGHRRCGHGSRRIAFNLPAVLGAAGLVSASGLEVSKAARNFDLWVMLAVAFACLPILVT